MAVSANGTRQGGQPVTLAEPATPRGADEFRIAAGLASWSPAVLRRSLLHEEGRQRTAARWRDAMTAHRGWLAAVPVVLVNAVAFGAQLSFWRAHLALVLEAVAVALATESIANYLAWQAHLAQLADDAALRLRLAAYGTALVIGTLNYSHYMLPHWHPTVAAVTFGMMSAISPWLWSVHSRRVSRDALKSRGLIEPHAVRLGVNRWLWHPARSVRVMSAATWAGETDPAMAIACWRPRSRQHPAPDGGGGRRPPSPGEPPAGDAPRVTAIAILAANLAGILAASDSPVWPPEPPPDPRQDDRQDDRQEDDRGDAIDPPLPPPNPRQGEPSALDRAVAKIRRYPGWPDEKVAEKAGVSPRTVQRARAAIASKD